MSSHKEIDRLFSRYLDGTIDADKLKQLEQQLVDDPEIADRLAKFALVHRQTLELLNERTLHQLLERPGSTAPLMPRDIFMDHPGTPDQPSLSVSHPPDDGGQYSSGWLWDLLSFRRSYLPYAAMLAVAVAALLWGPDLIMQGPGDSPSVETTATVEPTRSDVPAPAAMLTRPEEPAIVATLTRVAGCVWSPNAPALNHGQVLAEGTRVALESGLVKITFECGAEVFLQGPCDFVVINRMLGELQSGKITANVPRRAFAFAIRAPGVDFIDLGTDFGITVDEDGQSELHVFEGEVLYCQDIAETKSSDVVHVTEDNAVKFPSLGTKASKIALNMHQFSRHVALRQGADAPSAQPVSDHLALWLAADMAIATDDQQRVIAWQDIIYGDNQSAEDAVQDNELARPTLVADGLNGRPSVRFDGNSDFLLTTPIETTDDQTVVLVCQFSESAYDSERIWGGQILNYDGPPSRFLSNTLEPGVLQIGEPLLAEDFQPTLIRGQVFAGFIGSVTVEAGRIDARPVGANSPVVVSYLYDYNGGRSALSINGQLCGEGNAFAPQGVTSRKIIGRHAWMQNFFHGDLAELLIFNEALSEQELEAVTLYLADKYAITIGPEALADEGTAE